MNLPAVRRKFLLRHFLQPGSLVGGLVTAAVLVLMVMEMRLMVVLTRQKNPCKGAEGQWYELALLLGLAQADCVGEQSPLVLLWSLRWPC